MTSFTSTVHR